MHIDYVIDNHAGLQIICKVANWSTSCQLGFLTMICLFAIFAYVGPEKPHWGVVN